MSYTIPLILIYVFLGALCSSFFTLAFERFKDGERWSIFTWRSRCNSCKEPLSLFAVIPLFWYLFTLGKHKCWAEVPLRYPLIELFSWILWGLIWFLISQAWITSLNLVLGWILLIWFVSASVYDFLFKEVSWINSLILIVIVWIIQILSITHWVTFLQISDINYHLKDIIIVFISSLLLFYWVVWSRFHILISLWVLILAWIYSWITWQFVVILSLVFFSFFYLLVLVTKERGLGWGDLQFALVLGMIFLWQSMMGLSFIFILSAILTLPLFIYQKATKWSTVIPFWPLLFFTALIILCVIKYQS